MGSKPRIRQRVALLLVALVMASGLQITGAAPAQAAEPATRVATWTDANGRSVILRTGTYNWSNQTGFGWAKIRLKHNINSRAALRFIIKNPAGPRNSGRQHLYVAYANSYYYNRAGQTVYMDSREVRLISDPRYFPTYQGARVAGTLGVMTAYCVNPNGANYCPSWVDRALRSAGTTSEPTGTSDAMDGSSPTADQTDATTDAGYSASAFWTVPAAESTTGTTEYMQLSYAPLDPSFRHTIDVHEKDWDTIGPVPDDGT